MEKRTYTIGFFTSDYNRGLVSVVLDSLMHYVEKHDNLRVRVFDCFGTTLGIHDTSPGGEIYELPELKDFDGVIVQSHQIINESALASLGKRIRETGIPAVSIGDFMEGCTRINTDDYSAFRDITEHLIVRHGARSFLFIKGVERSGKGEAEARRQGFEDVCREHGIDPESISYADGSWLNRDGKQAARLLLANGRQALPDAIVSANDEMALGAMTALQEAGIRIPEDVIITGYDDSFGASLSNPRLTTVRRDFNTLVITAMETLRRVVKYHETLPEIIYSPYRTIFSGSCGCPSSADLELATLKKNYYRHNRELTSFYTRHDKITSELFRSGTPEELLDVMENNASVFGDGSFFICANDYYHESLFLGDGERIGSSENATHYSDRFILAACSDPGLRPSEEPHIYEWFSRSALMQVSCWKDLQFLLFYPLYFENLLMGFIILTKPPVAFDLNIHEVVLHLMEFAIENIRQKLITKNLNKRLDILYITDPLTGLYNRFGYDRLAEGLFRSICGKGSKVHVLFIDIDSMKQINDTLGHEYGDRAILAVTRAIKAACRPEDFSMRYGGDEFVIITDDTGTDLQRRIEENISAANSTGTLPFGLGVSIGEYCSTAGPEDTPDVFLERADRQMYRVKNEKKNKNSL